MLNVESLQEYEQKEKRLIEIDNRLQEIANSHNRVELSEIIALRGEAREIASYLQNFLNTVLQTNKKES